MTNPQTNLYDANGTTAGGDEVALLQAGETGAMIFLSVDKRDTIDLTVNANYERAPTGNAFLGTAYDALFSSFDAAYGSGIEHGVSSSSSVFDEALNGIDMSGKGNSSTAPRAFVNYIFFDQEMNYVRAGFLQITTAAQGIGVHETISLNDIIADRKGYLLAYLSNENAEEVAIHWDDFRVYHGKTNVVQAQAYYPGGATFNEHQRTASVKNKWKFQSKEWLPELRVYDFGPRGWDPLIWRTNAQDILADQFPDQSSYSLFRNNPIRYTDPDGRAPIDPNCPNCVADDQVLSLLYLNFVAARKNVANTIAGFIKAGPNVPFIIRNEFSVMTGEDGVPFLHESGPRITDKLSATVFGAIDGASIYPGGGPTGLLAKTGSRATLGSTSKQALRHFTRDGELGGVVNLFEGNSKKGLQHILERHSADDFLDKAKGDLFPSGTTNEQIFDAIGEVFNKGTRVSNPSKSVQTFEKKIKLNDQTDNYRLVIDQKNEEVVTFFRVGGTE